MTFKLSARQIHLWCAFFPEIQDVEVLEAYRSLLNEAERAQEARFHFARDRHRYLVTRALVRTVLGRYASVAPAEWVFTKNAYGRPEIANDDGVAREISFNVSHTNGLIILGVSHKLALGVDTENTRTRQVSLEIADRFFAPDETAELRALPTERQRQRFFEYWTLKESYIKARSMGLSIPLDHFSFNFPSDGIEISIHPKQNDRASRWRFWQMEIVPDYLAAVCAERIPGMDSELIVKKIVPLVSEGTYDYTLLRASTIAS